MRRRTKRISSDVRMMYTLTLEYALGLVASSGSSSTTDSHSPSPSLGRTQSDAACAQCPPPPQDQGQMDDVSDGDGANCIHSYFVDIKRGDRIRQRTRPFTEVNDPAWNNAVAFFLEGDSGTPTPKVRETLAALPRQTVADIHQQISFVVTLQKENDFRYKSKSLRVRLREAMTQLVILEGQFDIGAYVGDDGRMEEKVFEIASPSSGDLLLVFKLQANNIDGPASTNNNNNRDVTLATADTGKANLPEPTTEFMEFPRVEFPPFVLAEPAPSTATAIAATTEEAIKQVGNVFDQEKYSLTTQKEEEEKQQQQQQQLGPFRRTTRITRDIRMVFTLLIETVVGLPIVMTQKDATATASSSPPPQFRIDFRRGSKITGSTKVFSPKPDDDNNNNTDDEGKGGRTRSLFPSAEFVKLKPTIADIAESFSFTVTLQRQNAFHYKPKPLKIGVEDVSSNQHVFGGELDISSYVDAERMVTRSFEVFNRAEDKALLFQLRAIPEGVDESSLVETPPQPGSMAVDV